MLRPILLLIAAAVSPALLAQNSGTEWKVARPGVKEVQVPFASLRPSAALKIGRTADWVLVTGNAVWVASSKPFSVKRIDPATTKVVAKVSLPGEACSGLAYGFGSLWVPLCGQKPSLARVDPLTNRVSAMLPFGPAGPEGGVTASGDSVWIVTDKKGTLIRIDPATNTVRQKISIPPGSYNPLFSDGVVWITGFEANVLTAVDASTGGLLATIPVGPKPRFLTAGGGSVWTLNQGDGTVSRIDVNSKKLAATITVGIPGAGGEVDYGADTLWATAFDVPLSRIDPKTSKVSRQWVGRGGDSIRIGHDSIWLTDYFHGLLWRIPSNEALRP